MDVTPDSAKDPAARPSLADLIVREFDGTKSTPVPHYPNIDHPTARASRQRDPAGSLLAAET